MSDSESGKKGTESSEEEIVELVKGLDKDTKKRLRELKEAQNIPRDSIEFRIFSHVDQLSINIWNLREEVEARLTEMQFLRSERRRMHVELTTGNITRELKEGVKMNEDELGAEIRRKDWQIREHAMSIYQALGKLRSFVGHLGVAGEVLMSHDEYEEYAKKIVDEVEGFGVKLRH